MKDCHVIDEGTLSKLASFATVRECEEFIGQLEKVQPHKVRRGGFGIDAPDHKVNLAK
jgi:hypothetical protein